MNKNESIIALQHSDQKCNREAYKDGKLLKSLWLSIPAYCHLQCPYCFASTNDSNHKLTSFSIDLYEKIIREFAELGGEFIGIPGDGEPFHNANWNITSFIISLCDELKIKLALFTTGDLIFFESNGKPAKINKIDAIKDKDIVVLVKYNHSKPEIQNELVGHKNNYTQLRDRSIDLLINKYHFNDKRRRLGFVTSIMNENATHAEENGKLEIVNIFERTQKDNIIFDCDTILEMGRGKIFSKVEQGVPPQIDLKKVFDTLADAGAIGLEQGGTYVGNTCCDRILHHLYIKANGDVFPCIGCSREDLCNKMILGNVEDISLKDLWSKPLRRQLAENRYDKLVGICSNCENFQTEACYSCLGRCIANDENAFNKDGTINTIGCIHHKPSTSIWLSDVVDYIRTIREYKPTVKSLKEKGLETLWRPNKNIAFALWQLEDKERKKEIINIVNYGKNPHDDHQYKPFELITHSNVSKFSQKKHYKFSELQFPMNKVWDFIRDPYLFINKNQSKNKNNNDPYTETELDILIDAISQSFLSNIFLPSFKILYDKYDKEEKNILYTNFILYDNINEKYFYRSIVKNETEDECYDKSLIVSRWYENIKLEGEETNLWGQYCFNLSSTFRHELYGDYELKLDKNNPVQPNLRTRTVDVSKILEMDDIGAKVKEFIDYIDDDVDFRTKFNASVFLLDNPEHEIKLCELINSKIFLEIKEEDILDKIKLLYESINKRTFFEPDDNLNSELLIKFRTKLQNMNEFYTSSDNIDIIKKLTSVYDTEYKKGNGTRFINYFIYLGIMNKALGVNYYYLLHSTNFSSVNPKNQYFKANSKFEDVIKASGILLCTKIPINNNFRSELKLFLSNILAPLDEFYYKELYGEVQAISMFKEKIEAHRHTINNFLPPLFNYLDKVQMEQFGKVGLQRIKTILYDFIEKYEDLGRTDFILNELVSYFNSGNKIEIGGYKIYQIETKPSISESKILLNTKQQVDFFTICFNLLHNASKFKNYLYYDKSIYREIMVLANELNSQYIIEFINPGLIRKEVLELMNKEKLLFNDIKNTSSLKLTGGLAISKKICERNKWQLNCQTIDNNTTVFKLII